MKPKDLTKTTPPGAEERISVGVYVDTYILAVVERDDRSLIRKVSSATLLHAIHSIFPPSEISGHVGGKDPISQKKLEKGDARFDIEKEILGSLINEGGRTVRLLEPTKAKSIAGDITKFLRESHVSLKRFRFVLGRLQHAARIILAAKGMFSPLNKATIGDPSQAGVGKTSEARSALLNL